MQCGIMQQPLLRDMLPANRRPWADIQDSPFSSQEDSPPLALPFLSQGSCGPEASQHSETSSQRALRHRLDCAVRLGGSTGATAGTTISQPADGGNLENSPIVEDSLPTESQDLLSEQCASQLGADDTSASMQPTASQTTAADVFSNVSATASVSPSSSNGTSSEAFARTALPSVNEESTLQEQASKPYNIHHLFSVAAAKVPPVKAAATPQRRRSNAQKRQGCAGSATAQTPQGKRPRPSLTAAAAPQPKDPEPPEVDVWPRRLGKRENAIVGVKKSPEYKDFDVRRARGEFQGKDIPLTPDPTDDKVSKRKWEGFVMHWRKRLKILYAENGGQIYIDLEDPLVEADDGA